ncbi:MAG TPA: DUF1614 domain-containing protein [Methylomirabilota bacterium]|nr:DUF1614 domain-containing protein [Methylomirabilota bacterium]
MLLIVLLALALAFFVILVELRILSYAYRKIGIRPRYVFLILVLTLVGSHVNVPLYSVPATHLVAPQPYWRYERPYAMPRIEQTGRTIVAINVGGALIPTLLSIYLFFAMGMPGRMLIGTAIVAVVVNQLAQVVPGVGVAVPVLLPPFLAAAVALILAFRRAPPVAYVAGTMGTLIGADLLNLSRVTEMGAPVLSIGGAGTFDGVFLTGILAGLLA